VFTDSEVTTTSELIDVETGGVLQRVKSHEL